MQQNSTQNSRPFDLLSGSVNKTVLVELKDKIQMRGTLKAFDVHMNIVLENAESMENGEPKTKYGKVILRGDNILLISP